MAVLFRRSQAFNLRKVGRGRGDIFHLSGKSSDFLDNLGDLLDEEMMANPKGDNNEERHPKDGWRIIDWKKKFLDQKGKITPISPSPVESVLVRNRLVHFKRDDLLKLSGGAPISGNKARKMIALNNLKIKDFPACVVSYGGPQSNAMLSLAAIVHFKNRDAWKENGLDSSTDPKPLKRFIYYTKQLPRFLRNQPNGNLYRAQTLGMELVELSHEEYRNLFASEWGGPTEPPAIDAPEPGDSLWVPQGGACGMAMQGAWELAHEIHSFWLQNGKGRPLTVCIPGGTCSTAVLVNAALQDLQQEATQQSIREDMDIRVVVIPNVGDEKYAQKQMMSLSQSTWGQGTSLEDQEIPTVLPATPEGPRYFGQSNSAEIASYFRFGEPNADVLATFQEMQKEYGIGLDLIYGAPSWTILLRHFRSEAGKREGSTTFDPSAPLVGREIMYVHSGGLEGVNSQLMRYRYKGLIDEVQLPGRR